jgi:hypothetical protein
MIQLSFPFAAENFQCARCKAAVPIEKMVRHNQRKRGIGSYCKACKAQSQKTSRVNWTDEQQAAHNRRSLAFYHANKTKPYYHGGAHAVQ